MKRNSVFAAVCGAAAAHRLLSVGTLLCAAASVLASLLPPLLLARVIDGLTGGIPLTFAAALLYFGSRDSSRREWSMYLLQENLQFWMGSAGPPFVGRCWNG